MKSFFSCLKGFNYKTNVDLTNYNTFRIKAVAKVLVEVQSNKVIELIEVLRKNNKKFIVLGAGSNVVFASKVIKSVVVVISDKATIFEKEDSVVCGAGEKLSLLCEYYLKNGYSGLEWAVGIPASVGGATIMNAGAFSCSMKDVVKSVVYYDGKSVKKIAGAGCGFKYRGSIFKENNFIVLSVSFKFKRADKQEVLSKVKDNLLIRKEKQPSYPSAGSVFKNGENFYAGKLIEELGLKGKRIGGAQVSEKHANFIVNIERASGKDVVRLIKHIKKLAKIKYNATLCEEVVIQ